MNYKFFALLFFGLAIAYSTHAQVVGTTFPDMEAETVEDVIVTLPTDAQDKYTLVGLAYSKKSEDDMNTWFSPVYHKFIKEPTGVFASFGHDINVYFVPMFTGINAAATGTAKKKATKNIDPLLIPYLLFYKGSIKEYKKTLAFEKKDVPYIFLLNTDGKIVYATSGAYSDTKMDEIETLLDE